MVFLRFSHGFALSFPRNRFRGEAVERYGTTSEWMGPVTALAGLKVLGGRRWWMMIIFQQNWVIYRVNDEMHIPETWSVWVCHYLFVECDLFFPWLVVWNIFYFFHILGIIIPIH